jgi:hypothetical protein
MSNPFRTYRLPLALATGFLVLALQVSGVSSVFARSVTHSPVVPNDIVQLATLPNSTSHDSSNWGGNEVTGARGTFRAASVEFRIPTISDPPSTKGDLVAFWAGVGGDPSFSGSSYELVQAGIASYIDSSGGQYNYAWYEYVGTNGTVSPQHIHFNQGLNAGDKIAVTVESNYLNSGNTQIFITDERSGETESPSASAEAAIPFSDSATGECIGERSIPTPLAEYNPSPSSATPHTVFLNDCVIYNNSGTSHPVGPGNGWANTNWYHIVGKTGDLVEGIGAVDSSGSFPLNWKARF